jgi:hypothetical protein
MEKDKMGGKNGNWQKNVCFGVVSYIYISMGELNPFIQLGLDTIQAHVTT